METSTNRREFLAAGGVGAAMLLAANGKAHAEDVPSAAEKVVNDFCAAWETMDSEKLASFLDDGIVFRMMDTAPFVEGKEAMMGGIKQFLATYKSANFEMVRSAAFGNIVVNERIDHFENEDREDAFHVTGVFLVKEGKIVEWRDYMMPEN